LTGTTTTDEVKGKANDGQGEYHPGQYPSRLGVFCKVENEIGKAKNDANADEGDPQSLHDGLILFRVVRITGNMERGRLRRYSEECRSIEPAHKRPLRP